MAQDLLYDKDKLLEELSKSGTNLENFKPPESNQEVDELHELFGQVVGLQTETEPAKPKERAPRMTHQQLTAMKVVAKKVEDPRVSFMQLFSQSLIQIGCAVKSWFTSNNSARVACQDKGHVCLHCGVNVPYHPPQK